MRGLAPCVLRQHRCGNFVSVLKGCLTSKRAVPPAGRRTGSFQDISSQDGVHVKSRWPRPSVERYSLARRESRIMTGTPSEAQKLLVPLDGLLPELESAYKDIHAHPELSMQERRTAQLAADHLRGAGYEVTAGIGNTGV